MGFIERPKTIDAYRHVEKGDCSATVTIILGQGSYPIARERFNILFDECSWEAYGGAGCTFRDAAIFTAVPFVGWVSEQYNGWDV